MSLGIQDREERPEDPRALTSSIMLIAARGSVAPTDPGILGSAFSNGGIGEKPSSLDEVALENFRAEHVRQHHRPVIE